MRILATLITLTLLCIMSTGAWSAEGGAAGGPDGGGHGGPPPGGSADAQDAGGGADAPPPPPPLSREEMEALLKSVFTAADADASGMLSPSEFAVAIADLHAKMSAHAPVNAPRPPPSTLTDAQRAAAHAKSFAAADANGDGVLSIAEFTVAVRLLAPHHHPPGP